MTERKKRGPNKCPNCKKNPAEPIHACPYNADINNDDSEICKCCSDCCQECANDI